MMRSKLEAISRVNLLDSLTRRGICLCMFSLCWILADLLFFVRFAIIIVIVLCCDGIRCVVVCLSAVACECLRKITRNIWRQILRALCVYVYRYMCL